MVAETLLLMKTSHLLQSSHTAPQPNAFSTRWLYSPAVPISGPWAATEPLWQDLNPAEVCSAG